MLFQPQDRVIGLHPSYVFSFAPAEVLGVFSNHCVKVEFYDGVIGELGPDDVYKISKLKQEQVVDYIKMRERLMIGKTVVARDDTTGLYKLGRWKLFLSLDNWRQNIIEYAIHYTLSHMADFLYIVFLLTETSY